MSKHIQEEQFERYFAGDMSEEELRQLEAQVEGDPLAKSEFQWQKALVDGIKDYRYAELKARLASIPVSMFPTQFWAAASSAVVVGGITATLLFTDFLNEPDSDPEKQEVVVSDKSQNSDKKVVAPQKEEPKEEIVRMPKEVEADPAAEKARTKNTLTDVPAETNAQAEQKQEEIVEKPVENQEVAPKQPVFPAEDEAMHSSDDYDPSMVEPARAARASNIDVDMVADPNYDFHYKYYNHKLFLYGNLKEEPYRLLELENNGNYTLYLAYQNSYYLLKENTLEPTELKPIKDRALKKSLAELDSDK